MDMSDKHEMARLIARLQPDSGKVTTFIPGVSLMRLDRHQPRSPVFYDPGIFFVAQGHKIGHLGEETYHYDLDHYLVMAVPLPFECETLASEDAPFLGMRVSADVGLLRELLLQIEAVPGQAVEAEASPSAPMASVPLDEALREAATRLLRCLLSPLESQILGPQLVREIVFRALLSEQGAALRAAAGRHSHYGRMARALRRIHTEYASALDIDTLAREAHMSVSTFHHNFKAMTYTSPLQYLKSVRLHKAWMLMVQDGLNASTAAGQVGYESASQFSREFKRYFGRSPTAEANAARP
jgi:AraC-like DNA-binding protein